MQYNSYIIQNTKTALSLPLNCPPPRKLNSGAGFGRLLSGRHCEEQNDEAIHDIYKNLPKSGGLPRSLRSLAMTGRKIAFTLAEVLLTLTIIGVIATITIPTIYTKYQKLQYVVGLKKAYSTLSNAYKLANIDNSLGDYICDRNKEDTNSCKLKHKEFMERLMSQLKVNEYYGQLGDSNAIVYQTKEHVNTINLNKDSSTIWRMDYVFRLNDGTPVGIRFTENVNAYFWLTFCQWGHIAIDVNKVKGPNQLGRDIFAFTFDANGIRPYNLSDDCNFEPDKGIGMSCSNKIMLEGWQMNY